MSKPRTSHQSAHLPIKLTDLQLLECMEWKVAWNLGRYRDAIEFGANDPLSATYASLDYCIAVISYRDWICLRWEQLHLLGQGPRIDDGPKFLTQAGCRGWLNRRIDYLLFCQQVANTAKHGHYDDRDGLREPEARMRAWLTPAGAEACSGMNDWERGEFILRNPSQCSYDRELYAEGYPAPLKAGDVLHLPFEQLRDFALKYGIR